MANEELTPDLDSRYDIARRSRFAARQWLRSRYDDLRIPRRLSACGLSAHTPDGYVPISVGTALDGSRRASAGSLLNCSSVWACPVCSHRIASERGDLLAQASKKWRHAGGNLIFATFTMRHSADDSLATLWDSLSGAWRSLLGGKGWLTLQKKYALAGWVRAVEVTHGVNGWHVHAHVAFYINPGTTVTNDFTTALQNELFSRWSTALAAFGLDALPTIGVDIRRTYADSGLARYMTKTAQAFDLSAEMSRGANKTTTKAKKSRTPFMILAGLVDGTTKNPERDFSLWQEWELASTGRRMMTWSTGIRDLINAIEMPAQNDSDEHLEDRVEVLRIPGSAWRRLLSAGQVPTMYELIEKHGVPVALGFLQRKNCVFIVSDYPPGLAAPPRAG